MHTETSVLQGTRCRNNNKSVDVETRNPWEEDPSYRIADSLQRNGLSLQRLAIAKRGPILYNNFNLEASFGAPTEIKKSINSKWRTNSVCPKAD